MASMMEMTAFEDQINLTLLNDIIAFVADTANMSMGLKQCRHFDFLINFLDNMGLTNLKDILVQDTDASLYFIQVAPM